jgi:hypothetical protein
MRIIVITLAVLAACIVVGAQLPSDLIAHQERPSLVNLHCVSPTSAKAISQTNEALEPWQGGLMPDFGHYRSEAEKLVGENGIPMNLTNYTTDSIPPLSASIGNVTNATNVTEINGTLVYL